MRLTWKFATGLAGAIIITSLGAANALAASASASASTAAHPVSVTQHLTVPGNVSTNYPTEISGSTQYPGEVSG